MVTLDARSTARFLEEVLVPRYEHWRIAFRRRYFTRRNQLARSLEAFLEFYNHQRPHQGYRTRGRTPAEVFYGLDSTAA